MRRIIDHLVRFEAIVALITTTGLASTVAGFVLGIPFAPWMWLPVLWIVVLALLFAAYWRRPARPHTEVLPTPILTFGLTLDPYGAPEVAQRDAFTVDEWRDLQFPSDGGPHYCAVELPDGYELAAWMVFETPHKFWRGTEDDRRRWYSKGFPARGRNPTAPCRLMVRKAG
ncbi:MAG: hypothetical protein OXC94_08155 [Chloroflexi bacterium]|nr:hypothetical protein [Chloroflexota bacterium]